MPFENRNAVAKKQDWVEAEDYAMEDLALDIEVLESCRDLYLSSRKDEDQNWWVDLSSQGYLDCDNEFKTLMQDVIEGLRKLLIGKDSTGNMPNRVKFVQMGFRLIQVSKGSQKRHHVLKLYHPGSKNHILLDYS